MNAPFLKFVKKVVWMKQGSLASLFFPSCEAQLFSCQREFLLPAGWSRPLPGTIATAPATNSMTRTVTRRKLEAKLLGAAQPAYTSQLPVSEAPPHNQPPRLPWPTCRRVTFYDSRDRDWKWFTDCHVELDEVASDKPVVSKKLADGQK